MSVEGQSLINLAFTSCGAMAGFIIKALWDAMRALQEDLVDVQSSVSSNYVRRDDFRDHAQRLEDVLARIERKLDGKVDKP